MLKSFLWWWIHVQICVQYELIGLFPCISDYLASLGVCEVFVLCTKGELSKYRVSKLFSIMKNTGLKVHHFPFPDGQTPSIGTMLKLLEDLRTCLKEGHKTLIQWVNAHFQWWNPYAELLLFVPAATVALVDPV